MNLTTLILSFLVFSGQTPSNTKESLHALLTHLHVGKGATIADIGAGRGNESWVFAEIVGKEGHVFSEEIGEGKVKELKRAAKKRELTQVQPVLGTDSDPCIPDKSVDLMFMKRVYHHFSKPRPMLRAMWNDLKPGGYLVIVDQRRGTLQDWVPRKRRAERHYWIAETTVVREAREEGFEFFECAEQCWHEKRPFVAVFRRPKGFSEPKGDPDPFKPIDLKAAISFFTPQNRTYNSPLFIALGGSRTLMPALLKQSSGKGVDIILEEWATQKAERPQVPKKLELPSVLTEKGDPKLADKVKTDAVFFLDTYHRLFHHKVLLEKLKEKLTPGGMVYILDRKAEQPLDRRLASHKRKIHPDLVKKEMQKAGFSFAGTGPAFAKDRFLLIFKR